MQIDPVFLLRSSTSGGPSSAAWATSNVNSSPNSPQTIWKNIGTTRDIGKIWEPEQTPTIINQHFSDLHPKVSSITNLPFPTVFSARGSSTVCGGLTLPIKIHILKFQSLPASGRFAKLRACVWQQKSLKEKYHKL